MNYDESIGYLYNLQRYGIKFGLDNIRALTAALENPHTRFRTVHVAGTNGKGSTSAIIASILRKAGCTVGLFTSPHLISFTERIRVNGVQITEPEVSELAVAVREAGSRIDGLSPTFFEVVTAMAFLHFARNNVDVAVMEVGMGGRLDATNIIEPEVCVITPISVDHAEFLGRTLEEIAAEKAGIMKRGIPVVSASQTPEALAVLSEKAARLGVPFFLSGRDFSSQLIRSEFRGITFSYRDQNDTIEHLFLPLAGEHQMENASVGIRAASIVMRQLDPDTIREGVGETTWPGRLEFIADDPPILIDGAHNPAAAVALADAIRNIFMKRFDRIVLVAGIMGDKDIEGILRPLLPIAHEVVFTRPAYARAASPETLATVAASMGFGNVRVSQSVRGALEFAVNRSRTIRNGSPLVVVTGSFYTIGEAKAFLGHTGILTTLRE